MALLEIDQLSFRVPARPVLDGVDLSVDAAEIQALVGTNGTGKSTLAYLVMGCEGCRPSGGEIRFASQRIDALPLYERERQGITLAWQEPASIRGAFGARLSLPGCRRSGCGGLPGNRKGSGPGQRPADHQGEPFRG